MPNTRQGVPINKLDDAIGLYRADAAKLYVDAHDGLPPLPQESPEDTLKRSQRQLQGAFSQLSSAETMESAQRGREGYAEVVKLMTTTRITADVICGKLAGLATALDPAAAQPNHIADIRALTEALQALAQISPVAVWQGALNADGTLG